MVLKVFFFLFWPPGFPLAKGLQGHHSDQKIIKTHDKSHQEQ